MSCPTRLLLVLALTLLSQLLTESFRVLCLLPPSLFSLCCCRSSSVVSCS